MGKTRDLFKKIRDTKGTFHAKMGPIKERNGMDLTEAEDIKNRWQEYTEELYKTDLTTQIITMVLLFFFFFLHSWPLAVLRLLFLLEGDSGVTPGP